MIDIWGTWKGRNSFSKKIEVYLESWQTYAMEFFAKIVIYF